MKHKKKMSAKQKKYFGKKTKKVKHMAKKHYVKHAVGRAGGFKGMLAPIIAGVGDSYLDPLLPIDGVAAVATGMFMHNSTIKDIGLYKVGMSLGNILPLPGRSGTQGGLL